MGPGVLQYSCLACYDPSSMHCDDGHLMPAMAPNCALSMINCPGLLGGSLADQSGAMHVASGWLQVQYTGTPKASEDRVCYRLQVTVATVTARGISKGLPTDVPE